MRRSIKHVTYGIGFVLLAMAVWLGIVLGYALLHVIFS